MSYHLLALLLLYNLWDANAGLSCTKVAPSNGKVVLKFRGRIAKFSCNPGFVLDGDKIATCIRGKWDAVPRCVFKIQCKQVKEISNGEVMLIRQRTVVKFTCDSGYKLIGSASTVSCSDYNPDKSKAECIPDVELSCDFEDGLCGWENDIMTGFPWLLRSNATPSHALKTGPSGDHTTNDGHYLYIETSGMGPDEIHQKAARLYSPLFSPVEDSSVCFTFWYHMYGYSIGTLNVYLNNLLEFTQSGDLGNIWRKGIIKNLPTNRKFQIVIEATSGNGYAGDIAIDDVTISNSTDCVQKTLIETTCEGRCFETETNSSLCQCSSDCIVEGSCCADFMNFCSYDSSDRRGETENDDFGSTKLDQLQTLPSIGTTAVTKTTTTESSSSTVSTRVILTQTVQMSSTAEALTSTRESIQGTENDLDLSASEQTTKNYDFTEITSGSSSSEWSESSEGPSGNNEEVTPLALVDSSTDNSLTNEIEATESSTVTECWDETTTAPEAVPSPTVPQPTLPSTPPIPTTGLTLITTPRIISTTIQPTTNSSTSTNQHTNYSLVKMTPTTWVSNATSPATLKPALTSTSLPPTVTTSSVETTATPLPTITSIHPSRSSRFPTLSSNRTHLLTSPKMPTRPVEIVTTVKTTQFIEFVPQIDNQSKTNWTSIYKPKGHYTYSAAMKLESAPKAFTYLGVALSLIVLLASIVFVTVRVIRRRRLLVEEGTEEGDVLFMTSDEVLDFSVARRPLCENTQQRC